VYGDGHHRSAEVHKKGWRGMVLATVLDLKGFIATMRNSTNGQHNWGLTFKKGRLLTPPPHTHTLKIGELSVWLPFRAPRIAEKASLRSRDGGGVV